MTGGASAQLARDLSDRWNHHVPRALPIWPSEQATRKRQAQVEDSKVKITIMAATAIFVLVGSIAHAQNASTGATTSAGDSAVSPATGDAVGTPAGSDIRPSAGSGVASGALNNGTTGDTIGTGSGASNRPSDSLGTSPTAGAGRKE
jgi:hypothetical protein